MTSKRKARTNMNRPRSVSNITQSGTLFLRAGAIAAVVLAVAALGVFLVSRSGSSNPGPAAQSSTPTAQTGPVAFAQCVRSHGVPDFPDPQNGHFLISGNVQSEPNFQSATQACQHLLPNGATNGGTGGSNNAQLLAFAHCMQTHGVPQFPDPTANGAIGLPQGVDPHSAQFQQAWTQCQSNLPGSLQGQQP